MKTDSILDVRVENSFAGLPAPFYTLLSAKPLNDPCLLHANIDVAGLLGLSASATRTADFLDVCAGKTALPGGKTLSAVYSGHQFGVWAGDRKSTRLELQSLMRISYAVSCLKTKTN